MSVESEKSKGSFLQRWSPQTVGFGCALCSAVCYTVSLGSMRGLTNYDVSPYWSLTIKELTIVICVLPVIIYLWARGKYRFPKWGAVWALIAAGVSCEVVGSIPHLLAYAAIGIAIATVVIQASQLIFSSIVGAVWLKERISVSKFVALALLIVAVALLGFSDTNGGQIAGKDMRLGLGIFLSALTALGYAGQLSIMRRVIRDEEPDGREKSEAERVPTSFVMVAVVGVGVVVCGALLTLQEGFRVWIEPPAACWKIVLTAGVANMLGFFFQIEGLRRLYVLKQTLVATAQTATLCLLGIFLFGEPFGWTTGLGIALVIAGVVVSGFSK